MRSTAVCLVAASLIWVATRTFPTTSFSAPAAAAVKDDVTESKPQPVLVELFTSEGCSNCPTADRFLVQLQKLQPVAGVEIIALGQHVDYWNGRGWVDPYSSAQFSARQHDYAGTFGNDGVYTPQMIVDGQDEFVGSDRERALEAIADSARKPKASVQISRADASGQAGGKPFTLQVRAEGLDRAGSHEWADVWLAITEDDLDSRVGRGENAGRRLQHVAVVREMRAIGKVEPVPRAVFSSETLVTPRREWNRGKLRAVVFVQGRRTKRILGAAALQL